MATILPSINLKDHEVRDMLNKHGGRTDNEFGSKFKALANINKWAKYKPVSSPIPFILSEQELKEANYGLSDYYIGRSVTPKGLMDESIGGTDFYPYVPPSGGKSSPYRIADFRGYNPKAEPPYIKHCYDTFEPTKFPAYITYNLGLNRSSNAEIRITDLAAFENVVALTEKFGILWTAEDGLYYLYYVPSASMEDGISLELEVNRSGVYHFLAVWFNAAVQEGNNDVTSEAINFVPIPDSYQRVVVTQKQIWGVVHVAWDALEYLYYDTETGMVQGFSASYPSFTMSFPNGEPPACEYRIGVSLEAVIDGATYQGTYWYDEEHIIYTPPRYDGQTFINFPSGISLSDVLRISLEGAEVESIQARLDLERVSGDGYLQYDNMNIYNVTIV